MTAALVVTYVGCATQEEMGPESLGLGSGAASNEPKPNEGGSGGAAGSEARPEGGSAGATAGVSNRGGAPPSDAGATGGGGSSSGAASGGRAGATSGGAGGSSAGSGGRPSGGTGAAEPDKTPPSTPGSVQTSAITTSSVTVTWTESTDNVGVAGYRLFNGNIEVTALLGKTYTFQNLDAGTAYTFAVQAYDAAQNHSARATKSATTAAPPAACQAGSAVAKLNHGQSHTVSGSACLELNVNPAWNPVEVLLEQTGGGTLTYSYKSCTGSGSGTIATVLTMYEGTNPACNFFVQLSGNGTVVYYD